MQKSHQVKSAVETTIADNPYVLDPKNIQAPPTTFKGSLKFLGPGMITSAAVVGSGELITATTLGAKVGWILFWLVFVSTFVKVFVQIELARFSISTGKAAITGFDETSPKIKQHGWMAWLVLLMFVQFIIGQAGVLSAAAFAFSALLPIGGDPFSLLSIGAWVAILAAIAIGVHWFNKYSWLEKISTVLVVIVTAFAVLAVFLLIGTQYTWTLNDLFAGMRFQIGAGAAGIALAMFGMTGVGAGEVTTYSYWVVEKGYAAWTGPNDGSEAWVKRARGWIKVMKIDVWVSWFVYTISTVAFYVLGAAVLHPQKLEPAGNEVMTTISSIFSTIFGQAGGVLFMLGAGIALFKTILANVPGFARLVTNTLSVLGAFEWKNAVKRDRWMRITMVILPITWAILGTVAKSPLALVVLAGILNAVFLMGVAVCTLQLQKNQTDSRVKDGVTFQILLIISAIVIFAVGAYSLWGQISALL
ncbi:Nramp family divalent metal transporter [Arcanobacterium hippocoleae]|uniref:Mn2+/Fe2+ NRAMP family transporter n=1 Tax=Arcanobacterium hippocoleae TaxID=149017 RepID=A0ABU1T146_9ACTO|nr:Nramp family divalent metal transporter [Arcanobacterium hippocoleae]MDR6939058.1 Mn2+/Fe2+ NRAMP family transporter [Arcanobacterium hippocoleae]